MELKLDLHVHSARSPDGIMSLDEIAALEKARGLHGAAVCDHDLALIDPPRFQDFLLIPGIEVSTQFGHLLGLFVTGPVETRDFFAAVELIRAQGGLAVLAHPFEHSRDGARLAPAVPLLDGIEVWNSRADRKIHDANALELSLEAVKAALRTGTARAEGRRGRAWYAARSQLTKRRRAGARPWSYVKWAAFAAKCCAQDIVWRGV